MKRSTFLRFTLTLILLTLFLIIGFGSTPAIHAQSVSCPGAPASQLATIH